MTRKRKVRGFTLLEILIVIAIIGALAVMILPRFLKTEEKAWIAKAGAECSNLRTAIAMYHSDTREYPPSLTTLDLWDDCLVENTAGVEDWDGPYCDRAVDDPWGNSYEFHNYFADDENYSYIGSGGPDGAITSNIGTGTTKDDDIIVWIE